MRARVKKSGICSECADARTPRTHFGHSQRRARFTMGKAASLRYLLARKVKATAGKTHSVIRLILPVMSAVGTNGGTCEDRTYGN